MVFEECYQTIEESTNLTTFGRTSNTHLNVWLIISVIILITIVIIAVIIGVIVLVKRSEEKVKKQSPKVKTSQSSQQSECYSK